MHAGTRSLSVLQQRVTPLQLNFVGFAGSAGSRAVDALVTDALSSPPELKQQYSERL